MRSCKSRNMRLKLAGALAAGLLAVGESRAAIVYDDLTSLENSVVGTNFTVVPDSSGEYMGNALTLSPGTTDITGFDFAVANVTGINLSGFQVNVAIWGSVNLGTINTSSPAYSNLIATASIPATFAFPSNMVYTFGNSVTGTPAVTFTTPIGLPSNAVGITFNFQGTTDGVNYSNMPGLTSIVTYGVAPTVGSTAGGVSGYQAAASGDYNGNFVTAPKSLPQALYPNQAYGAILDGDILSATPDNWINPNGGVWETAGNWSSNLVPNGGIKAFFNLGSAAGYAVEIPGNDVANSLTIQNDRVSFDLDALASHLAVVHTLTVGQPATGNTATGSLTLMNSGAIQTSEAEASSIVVGANGGTGTLTVNSNVYLISDTSTTIGPGSWLAVGAFGKFGTSTLSIAGTTNAWTGKLDLGTTSFNLRSGDLPTVMNQLKTGFNNGTWTGQGIISGAAHLDTTHLTAVGAILNNDGKGNQLYGSGTALGLFDGDNPATTSVLTRYTYYGDANLDGQVDGSDYSRIDNGMLLHLSGWYNGDFNYDGVVNGSDYTLIDNVFNRQGPNLVTNPNSPPSAAGSESVGWSGGSSGQRPFATLSLTNVTALSIPDPTVSLGDQIAPTSVPEPAGMGLLAIGAIAILRRRTPARGGSCASQAIC